MEKIITSFSNKYAISRNEIITEIESVFSSLLSQFYRMEVVVFFREDLRLEAIGYGRAGGMIIQTPIDISGIKNFPALKKAWRCIWPKPQY